MDEYDFSDNIVIKITKAKDYVGFSHWESDLYIKDELVASSTAPTMYGAVDNMFDYLEEEHSDWTKDDANAPR